MQKNPPLFAEEGEKEGKYGGLALCGHNISCPETIPYEKCTQYALQCGAGLAGDK